MKLHAPGFESALRRGVKKEIRESPELRREFKKANKFRKRGNLAWLVRICWALAPALAVWRVAEITGHPAAAVAIVTLWSASLAFAAANNLVLVLFRSNDIPALAMLPVSESLIFRWELWKFFRRSLFSLGDLVACYCALAAYAQVTAVGWLLAICLAGLSWAMVLALAGLLTARLPRFPYQIVPFGIVGAAVVCFYTYKMIGAAVIGALDRAAPSLNLILPTGWAPAQLDLAVSGWNWGLVVLFLPIILVIWTVPVSLRILRGRYLFHEPTVPQSPDLIPANDAATAAIVDRDGTIPASPPGITAIEEIVRNCLFQAEPAWPKSGTAEGFLWRWLTPRERALAEFMFPSGLILTRRWKSLARNF